MSDGNPLCRTSKPFLYANGLLLLLITFIPFPTALLARYVDTPLRSVGVMCYALYAVGVNAAFLVWGATMQSPVYLGRPEVNREEIRKMNRRTRVGMAAYACTAIISWWLPIVGLALLVLLWVFWIMLSIGPASEA